MSRAESIGCHSAPAAITCGCRPSRGSGPSPTDAATIPHTDTPVDRKVTERTGLFSIGWLER